MDRADDVDDHDEDDDGGEAIRNGDLAKAPDEDGPDESGGTKAEA